MQGIEIPIGAPLGQLDKDLKDANGKLKNFAAEASKSAGVLGGSTVKGANQAAFALTNLGRVAQDAPFGFIGIQNNLNPLLESFQSLKKETGSTSGALKALGQSLIGPAGLGIALSVVSAAILFYQQYQQRANKATKEAKGETDDYVNSLNQVDQAMVKGAQNAQTELTTLKLLYNQYRNATLPLEQRKDAYKEIQKLYPAYFGNLKFERDATEKTKDAYDKLSSSIIATARARAGIDIITKNSKIQLEIESQQIANQTEINKILASNAVLTKRAAASQGAIGAAGIGAAGNEGVYRAIARNESKINDLNLKKEELNGRNNALRNKNLEIERLITGEIEKGAKLSGDVGGKGAGAKAEKDVKTVSDILAKLDIDLKKVANAVDITFGQGQKDKVKAFATAIDSLTEIKAGGAVIKGLQDRLLEIDPSKFEKAATTLKGLSQNLGVSALTAFGEGLATNAEVVAVNFSKPLKQGLTDWQTYVNDSLLPQLETNFKTFFDNVLMNGKFSFDSLGKALLNTLLSIIASDAAKQVTNIFRTTKGSDYSDMKGKGGSLLGGILGIFGKGGGAAAAGGAATGGGAAAAGGVAATGGALLPILAGVAAVAGIASLFKKKKQAPVPQTSATISTSAAGSSQDFAGGRVVFEISGTNLIGVLNRAGAKLTRFG